MPRPNASELVILKHLWAAGPQTAREIHNHVGPMQDWKASTTRTVLLRMEGKKWVARSEKEGVALYRALLDRTKTLGGLVRHLARSILDMDDNLPAALFAGSPHLSDAELDELDAIINAAESDEDAQGDKS